MELKYRCCKQWDSHTWMWVVENEGTNYLYSTNKSVAAILSGEEADAFIKFCQRNGDCTAKKEVVN